MKRFQFIDAAILLVVALGLGTMGFQCSSPNIASGKLYYQQYESTRDKAKLQKALESFEKEVIEKPNSAEGWYWLGFIHGVKEDYLKLQQSWEKSENLGQAMKNDIKANKPYFWNKAYNHGVKTFQKAQIKKDEELYAQAAESFKAAIMLKPDTTAKYGGYINYAYSLIAQDKMNEAIEPLREQNKRFPNESAYRLLGQIYTDQGNALKTEDKKEEANKKFDESLEVLSEGMTKFPESGVLNQELLNTYVAANRIIEAKPKFKDFAQKNPGDKMAQYAYGTILLETKEYEEAIQYLDKAVSIDPKMDNALYNLCVSYLRWGIRLRDDAEGSDSAPDYKEIIKKAVPHLEQLLQLKPDVAANWDLAGKIYASSGMTEKAQEAYKKADELGT